MVVDYIQLLCNRCTITQLHAITFVLAPLNMKRFLLNEGYSIIYCYKVYMQFYVRQVKLLAIVGDQHW